jgi:hypothetical protein
LWSTSTPIVLLLLVKCCKKITECSRILFGSRLYNCTL